MQQVQHLLIVDRKRQAGLASWYGPRWLLPVICCAERARAGPIVAHWLETRGLRGDLAGQWFGRVADDSNAIDWLVIVTTHTVRESIVAPLQWSSLRSLRCAESLFGYQQVAVRSVVDDEKASFAGPFGDVTWTDNVRSWIEDNAAVRVMRIVPQRVSAYEVVLELATDRGRMFFKGLWGERASEARVTIELGSVYTRSFAQTIAIEEQPNGAVWWLTRECAGTTVARHCSPRSLSRVVTACAAIQQRVAGAPALVPSLADLDLQSALAWCAELTSGGRPPGELQIACVPRTWIPLDLDPSNVLLDAGGSVRFIDLDDSYFGPAPLAVGVLARRIARRGSRAQHAAMKDFVHREYDRAWPAGRAGVDWPTLDALAAVVDAHLGWLRISRNTARGEIHGAIDLAKARLKDRMTKLTALYS